MRSQHEQVVDHRDELVGPQIRKKVRFSPGANGTPPDAGFDEATPILFVVYHNVWATCDARVLAKLMVEECTARGQE
ncbi:hypothetical protein FS749_001304, partial [Ceratobasidium sp. UAMH 11750]